MATRLRVRKSTSNACKVKASLSLAIREAMNASNTSVYALAKATRSNRESIRRILDRNNTAITLKSMSKVADALGLELTLTAKPMPVEGLMNLAQRMVDAPSETEATKLEDEFIAGFYGNKTTDA